MIWVTSIDMHILYVTDFLPHRDADGGGRKMFAYYMEQMRKRGHQISLVSIFRDGDERFIDDINTICDSVTTAFASTHIKRKINRLFRSLWQPTEYAFCESIGMLGAVSKALSKNQYDLIHVVQPWLIHVVLTALKESGARPRIVGHAIDVSTKLTYRKLRSTRGIKRLWAAKNYVITSVSEFNDLSGCDSILVHSNSDAVFIQSLLPIPKPIVISPVWFDAFDQIRGNIEYPRTNHQILYVGRSDDIRTREALIWFIRCVLPAIRNQMSDITLEIISVQPSHLHLWDGIPGVNCHSYEPSLLGFYDACSVFVAPLFVGGGQHLKILNAFARGCPVVMTSVANDGISAKHNFEAVIADDVQEFCKGVIRILSNPEWSLSIARNALLKVRELYKEQSVIDTLEEAYGFTRNNPIG